MGSTSPQPTGKALLKWMSEILSRDHSHHHTFPNGTDDLYGWLILKFFKLLLALVTQPFRGWDGRKTCTM